MANDPHTLIAELFRQKPPRYGARRTPCDFDSAVAGFGQAFLRLQPGQREEITAALSNEERDALRTFAGRMAEFAVLEVSEQRLLDGLLAIAIGDFRSDYREDNLVLSLLYRSGTKIRADVESVFGRAMACASDGARKRFSAFLSHPAPIEANGYREVIDGLGFRYERNW